MSVWCTSPIISETQTTTNQVKRSRSDDVVDDGVRQPMTLDYLLTVMTEQFKLTQERIEAVSTTISEKIDSVKAELDDKLSSVSREIASFKEECGAKFLANEGALNALDERVNGITLEIGGLEKRNELVISGIPYLPVIIVCSSINSPHTIATIRRLRTLRRTKLLLLDTAGQTTIFDGSSGLYRSLGRHDAAGRLNLLVLTALTERFKHALNAVHGIDLTSNYERLSERLLKIRLDDDSGLEEGPANDIRRGSSGRNVRVEWLAGVINSANLSSSSCDFNYLQTSASEELATLAHVDHDRCRTLLESYCGVDETTYGNSSFQFENASDSEELVRQQQQVDIDRLCTVLRKNRDLLVENSTNPAKRLIFSANFHLYEYILAVARNEPHLQQKFDFVVFDLQNVTAAVWRPLLIVRQDQLDWQRFTMHPVQPGYGDWMVASVATIESLWICGLLCWAVIGVMVFMVVSIVCASVVFSIAVRNYLLKTRLSKGPNKIVLSPSDFVFPVDMRRVDEGIEAMLCCWLQQLQEFGGPEVEKPDLLKGSIGSLKNLGLPAANTTSAAATTKTGSGSGTLVRPSLANAAGPVGGTGGGPGSGIGGGYGGGYGGIGGALEFKARYNGDLVQLKEIPSSSSGSSSSQELKNRAMDLLVMAHGLRHENINPLIGWLNEPTRTALVFEHCSRGSLQDVLIMDEIKLDWTFRLSLLTDLVRGMRYLHGSPIRVHGSLSSRNCVVDARWVLKITDYGIPGFFEAQGLVAPTKSAKDLLWTAPEALRAAKGYPRCGTQAADVYSFGIIMQEVVVRGEPFCMLSLAPEEIITKIKKPPPLIRPSVSKGAAPPEAINIMRQCWAESPEMRPDFVTICERFKQLNHGRKVNFVDTMFQMLEKYSNNLEELIRERTEQLDVERKKTEQLLNRMLPRLVENLIFDEIHVK
ncbi:hypothetical protein pipiens_004604 [Culex pipiens pipiens]|uniref:guanylate cyclase n=1 Tax=Culex pipiens pipiens TaxID=38569 RepID=A0ABD1CH24_CULPP